MPDSADTYAGSPDPGDRTAPSAWLSPTSGGIGALVSWVADDGAPRLASSSGTDSTIQLWDPQRSAAVGDPLAGHTGTVLRLAVCGGAGERLLASASEDGTVRLWDPRTGARCWPTAITRAGAPVPRGRCRGGAALY